MRIQTGRGKKFIMLKEMKIWLPSFLLVLFLTNSAKSQSYPTNNQNSTTIVISEFMTSNGSQPPLEEGELLDEDSDSSDWIEIYNPTDENISLAGWYLTDDANNLDQWQFPSGTELATGEFLVVFASGKNRTSAELHTNFKLDATGEYLALVKNDGITVAHEYAPKYPNQLTDIAYGLTPYTTTLVHTGVRASYRVPTANDAGANWSAPAYDDSAWESGPTGIGFGNASPGFNVIFYKANTTISDLSVAESVINNSSLRSTVAAETATVINYLNTGSNGNYASDNPFPSTNIGQIVEDFVVLVTGNVLIPIAGNWTFGVSSDDGFGLELTNGTHTMTFSHPEPRVAANTLATFNIPEPGFYELHLVFYNHSGNSELELFAAHGNYTNFDDRIFKLIGNTSDGGLYVRTFESNASTNIQPQMQNISSSLWTRIEFEGEEVDSLDSLELRIRYEDAFVVYLNGIEVARDNFTGTPVWNSVADSDRSDGFSMEFVNFDISEYLSDLQEGTNVLSIHGLNDSHTDGQFLILPELVANSNQLRPQYLTTATPGQPNVSSTTNLVADTKFSIDRGFYDEPFEVEITCATLGAMIHYTIDGSTPSETHGHEYIGPIAIRNTTCLRAVAFRPGWMSSNVDTQTYIFLNDVIRQDRQAALDAGLPNRWGNSSSDYSMDREVIGTFNAQGQPNGDDNYGGIYAATIRDDLNYLPTLSIVMNSDDIFGGNGIYSNPERRGVDWERPASVELIYPDGNEGFQVNCGIRIQGGWFRPLSNAKKNSFRLFFKRIYGPTKLQYPLFGDNAVDEFDTIVLRGGANDGYAWNGARYTEQYTRDEFGRSLQIAIGNAGSHGNFVHLYINGIYWGLYNPCERPDHSFSADYYGGDKENWDAMHYGQEGFEVINGDSDIWNQMLFMCRQAENSNQAYQELQGNNPDGTPNTDYPHLMDVPNYIDYLIVNIWGGNWDWPWKNWYAARDRSDNSTGFKFYCWDYENTIGNNLDRSPLYKNALNNNFSSAGQPHQSLRENPEYQMLFADRVHKFFFNEGILTPESLIARYANMADTVERAIVAESTRWGDQHHSTPLTLEDWYDRDSNYNDGRAGRDWILNYYLPQRSDIVLQQFRDAGLYPNVEAPVFYINGLYQHGGQISTTDIFSTTAPQGRIYYTLDGTDPRRPQGPQETVNGNTLVAENAPKHVLVPTSQINDNWKGGGFFNDAAWQPSTGSPGGIGYERSSGYQNYYSLDVEAQMYGQNTSCYIRIPFTLSAGELVDINFMTLKMRYDDGFIAYLNGAEVARRNFSGTPSWNSNASNQNDDSAAVSFENIDISDFIGDLQQGENLLAIHGLNISPTSSDFLISVELTAGESTPVNNNEVLSPSAIEYTSALMLDMSTHIKARVLQDNTWSALNEATYSVGPVADNLRITEIMYHPEDTEPDAEFIELKNIGGENLNLNLVSFTNGIDFTFPNLEFEANERILVVKDTGAFTSRYGAGFNIAGKYTGSLNNAGERIELKDAIGQTIHNFSYKDGWYESTDGLGFSLNASDPTSTEPNNWNSKYGWYPSTDIGGSPGSYDENEIPRLGDVVINELLAHSHAEAPDWIELYNTMDVPVNIGGWYLSDSNNNPMKYEIAEGTIIEPYGYIVFYEDLDFRNLDNPSSIEPFALSENGESLYLKSGQDGLLTGYNEHVDFGASETDISFGRHLKSNGTYDFVSMSWNTPGMPNAYPLVGPIVISEIMYHPEGDADAEYIELHNISDFPVTLAEYDNLLSIFTPWRFTDSDGISFDFPLEITMAAGEYLLLVRDINTFNSIYPTFPTDTQILEWGSGRLSNSGEKVELSKPGEELDGIRYYFQADRINYSDGSHPVGDDPWPIQPDGWGASLSRITTQYYGDDPNNWSATFPPTPGR